MSPAPEPHKNKPTLRTTNGKLENENCQPIEKLDSKETNVDLVDPVEGPITLRGEALTGGGKEARGVSGPLGGAAGEAMLGGTDAEEGGGKEARGESGPLCGGAGDAMPGGTTTEVGGEPGRNGSKLAHMRLGKDFVFFTFVLQRFITMRLIGSYRKCWNITQKQIFSSKMPRDFFLGHCHNDRNNIRDRLDCTSSSFYFSRFEGYLHVLQLNRRTFDSVLSSINSCFSHVCCNISK